MKLIENLVESCGVVIFYASCCANASHILTQFSRRRFLSPTSREVILGRWLPSMDNLILHKVLIMQCQHLCSLRRQWEACDCWQCYEIANGNPTSAAPMIWHCWDRFLGQKLTVEPLLSGSDVHCVSMKENVNTLNGTGSGKFPGQYPVSVSSWCNKEMVL